MVESKSEEEAFGGKDVTTLVELTMQLGCTRKNAEHANGKMELELNTHRAGC